MEFLPDFGLDAWKRRYHGETTAPEPYPAFKAKVAIAAIGGEQTLVELSQQFDVYANQLKQWKDQLLEGATGVFGDEATAQPAGPTVDVKTLHAKIGELTTEKRFFSRSARQGGIAGGHEMIDREHKLSVVRQAKLLGFRRGSVYFPPRPVPNGDLALMRRINELHLDYASLYRERNVFRHGQQLVNRQNLRRVRLQGTTRVFEPTSRQIASSMTTKHRSPALLG